MSSNGCTVDEWTNITKAKTKLSFFGALCTYGSLFESMAVCENLRYPHGQSLKSWKQSDVDLLSMNIDKMLHT